MKKTIVIVMALMLVVSVFSVAFALSVEEMDEFYRDILSHYKGSYEYGLGASKRYINITEGNFCVTPTGQVFYRNEIDNDFPEILFGDSNVKIDGRRVIYVRFSNGFIDGCLEAKN